MFLQVAQEYWQGYLKRNQSVVIDLFGAQLRNTLTYQCGRTSVRRLFVSCLYLVCILFVFCLYLVWILFVSCLDLVCILFGSCLWLVCILFVSCLYLLHHIRYSLTP
jgi:hypothetical protein